MKHGTTITLLTCSFIPEKHLTDISETLTKKTIRTQNRKKIQPQQNKQYLTQVPTQQHHPPKKSRKLQQHHNRMMINLYLNQGQQKLQRLKLALPLLTRTPLIMTTKAWSNLAPANQLNNLPL